MIVINRLIQRTKRVVFWLLVRIPQRLLPKAIKLRLLIRSGVLDAGWNRRVTQKAARSPLELAELVWADDRERVATPLFSADFYRNTHGFRGSPAEALLDYVLKGESEGKKPSELFDPAFFRKFNPGAPERLSALGLYTQHWNQYPNVHPHFDTIWYAQMTPEFAESGLSPLAHYIDVGMTSGKLPNKFFDPDWYLAKYPDIKYSGMSPALHFSLYGGAEMRNPGPDFDMKLYAAKHPDYAESGFDPLAHYLVMGRRSGIDASGLILKPSVLLPLPPRKVEWREIVSGKKIDVIIPVYRNLQETRKCVESVLASDMFPQIGIYIRNDSSPEPELTEWLRNLARADSRVNLSENEVNLGFVGSVNRSMRESLDRGVDAVILLNSDTEVAGDWIARLAAHALVEKCVSTVSATSNNATICSWPKIGENSLPEGLGEKELHALASSVNDGASVEVPTGVGFCMLITADSLRELGLFDEEAFGKGYGEENDFCMRAIAHGYRNLLAQDVFVHHVGEVSFSTSSSQGKARAGQVIAERYPAYNHMVAVHVGQDPGLMGRLRLVVAAWRAGGKPVTVLFTHHLGGGTEHFVTSRVQKLNRSGHSVVVRPVAGHPEYVQIENITAFDSFSLTLSVKDGSDMKELFDAIGATRVEIHHVLGFGTALRDGLAKTGIPHAFYVHDYFTICPQVTLTNADGEYCGEPGIRDCDACISRRPSHGAADIQNWRARHAWVMQRAEHVFAPSQDTARRMSRYSGADVEVVPHEPAVLLEEALPITRTVTAERPLRIVLLGFLVPHKGKRMVLDVLRHIVSHRIPARVILVGEAIFSADEIDGEMGGRFTSTGRYAEADLSKLLVDVQPDLFWFPSTAPETYSFTLSVAMRTGKPIVAANHGAFTERLATYPLHAMYPVFSDAADVTKLFFNFASQGKPGAP